MCDVVFLLLKNWQTRFDWIISTRFEITVTSSVKVKSTPEPVNHPCCAGLCLHMPLHCTKPSWTGRAGKPAVICFLIRPTCRTDCSRETSPVELVGRGIGCDLFFLIRPTCRTYAFLVLPVVCKKVELVGRGIGYDMFFLSVLHVGRG